MNETIRNPQKKKYADWTVNSQTKKENNF